MIFNSFNFLVFLPIVYIIYWSLNKKLNYQNLLILVSSYVFYGFWDWRFLFLIFFSSSLDYFVGISLYNSRSEKRRKLFLYISLAANLGLLGFFKYYNFFIESFIEFFSALGISLSSQRLAIILPVGISFYTFQTLSYTIDIYKRKIKPSKNPIEFFAFVSFFPQLVAGPIERASNLLPQFKKSRYFSVSDLKSGLRQILAGFFKKMVIADNCAIFVDQIFGADEYSHGLVLLFGVFFFAFQIYGDFSGYSDIGIGVARIFGIKLNKNFSYPYFSSSVRQFWKNWHISLSTWFRDYIYIPLGGSQKGVRRTYINLMITFTVSGLWHGANLTFVLWGFINGLYLVLENFVKVSRVKVISSKFVLIFRIVFTFILINLTWVFFRADSVGHAMNYLKGIFTTLFEAGAITFLNDSLFPKGYIALLLIGVLIFLELINRKKDHFLDIAHKSFQNRLLTYLTTILILIMFGSFYSDKEFIYFQF